MKQIKLRHYHQAILVWAALCCGGYLGAQTLPQDNPEQILLRDQNGARVSHEGLRVAISTDGRRLLINAAGEVVGIEQQHALQNTDNTATPYFSNRVVGQTTTELAAPAAPAPRSTFTDTQQLSEWAEGWPEEAPYIEPVEPAPAPEPSVTPAPAEPLEVAEPEPVDSNDPSRYQLSKRIQVAKLQILLDRHGLSPGVIDGLKGGNVQKALRAYRKKTGQQLNASAQAVEAALKRSGGAALIQYKIKSSDVQRQFARSIPVDYADKAKLPAMAYTSSVELLAERFHMSQAFLRKLNPNANFSKTGQVIRVANVGENQHTKVARIVADKGRRQVLAYSSSQKLIAAYPATIGSTSTPSPSGRVHVKRIVYNPNYTYNPKINFTQGDNKEILTIPPGPNGPVGSVWIALSKATYGIHGTPAPARIGKTSSNGCVRLTNWDAEELGRMLSPGVEVEFID